MSDATAQGQELGPCPFCGHAVAYSMDAQGRADGLIHELPMCERFKRMDVQQFITAMREALERSQPS